MTVDLSDSQLKTGELVIYGYISEYDSTSANDNLGTKGITIQLNKVSTDADKPLIFNLDGFENDGDKASFTLTLRRQSDLEILARVGKLSKSTKVAQQHPEYKVGDRIVETKRENFPLVEEKFYFANLGTQRPFLDSKIKFSLANDVSGDRFLLANLFGMTVAASETGILDSDENSRRGWFLEEFIVKIGAKTLTVDSDFPSTKSQSATQTSTLGASLGADASFSGVSGSGGISLSNSSSVTYDDFEVTNSGSNPRVHIYSLRQTEGESYDGPSDLPRQATVQTRLNNVPDWAKANMPIRSWVMFKIPQNMNMEAAGKIDVTVESSMKLRRVHLQLEDFKSFGQSKSFNARVTYNVDMSNLDIVRMR